MTLAECTAILHRLWREDLIVSQETRTDFGREWLIGWKTHTPEGGKTYRLAYGLGKNSPAAENAPAWGRDRLHRIPWRKGMRNGE